MDETYLSVRFKHGAHTILLFVDSLKPFSDITDVLLKILRDRFPRGLTQIHLAPEKTPLPDSDADVRVAYALPVNAHDPAQGWRDLKITGTETPVKVGLKEGCAVAFAFLEEDEDEPEFVVDVPSLEDGGAADGEEEE